MQTTATLMLLSALLLAPAAPARAASDPGLEGSSARLEGRADLKAKGAKQATPIQADVAIEADALHIDYPGEPSLSAAAAAKGANGKARG